MILVTAIQQVLERRHQLFPQPGCIGTYLKINFLSFAQGVFLYISLELSYVDDSYNTEQATNDLKDKEEHNYSTR